MLLKSGRAVCTRAVVGLMLIAVWRVHRVLSQVPTPAAIAHSVEQRYHGDTLLLSGTGERAGFVQRQVFCAGSEHGPDTSAVAWMHLDSLKRLDTYLFHGDSIWLLRAGVRQPLSGRAAIFPRALLSGWRAHNERIATTLLKRP